MRDWIKLYHKTNSTIGYYHYNPAYAEKAHTVFALLIKQEINLAYDFEANNPYDA